MAAEVSQERERNNSGREKEERVGWLGLGTLPASMAAVDMARKREREKGIEWIGPLGRPIVAILKHFQKFKLTPQSF